MRTASGGMYICLHHFITGMLGMGEVFAEHFPHIHIHFFVEYCCEAGRADGGLRLHISFWICILHQRGRSRRGVTSKLSQRRGEKKSVRSFFFSVLCSSELYVRQNVQYRVVIWLIFVCLQNAVKWSTQSITLLTFVPSIERKSYLRAIRLVDVL